MTCSSCNFQFCWLCNGEYKVGHYDMTNPFGCPGMQFKNEDSLSPIKRVATKVLVGTGITIASVIGIGIATAFSVVAVPTYGVYWIYKFTKEKNM